MHYRVFFSILFFISISICLLSTFTPETIDTHISSLFDNTKINSTVIGLFSLVIAVLAYISLLIALYQTYVIEKKRLDKLEKERHNIDLIHAELSALRE